MADNRHWARHCDRMLHLIRKPRFGIISDFDGTLSRFVTHPEEAEITPANEQALDALAGKVTVIALVSGRSVIDLRKRFERPWAIYYGGHGMEFWNGGGIEIAPQAERWIAAVQTLLATVGEINIPGVFVENKGVTASVHYRMAYDTADARQKIYRRLLPLCDRYGMQLSEGQFVWEIKPPVKLTKGTAAQTIVETYDLESVLFLGDDLTDANAMSRLHQLADDRPLMALSIGVLHPTTPTAVREHCDLVANGVKDVEWLLEWVNENRPTL